MGIEININDSTIDGGAFNGTEIVNGDKNTTSFCYKIPTVFSEYLDDVIISSDNKKERECAVSAKKLFKENNMINLKKYIIDNINTFVTGTFATAAGGMLLEIIQNIIK